MPTETEYARSGKLQRMDGSSLNEGDFWANQRTAFDELRVAEYSPVLDLKSAFGLSARRDVTAVTGSGSVTATNGEISVATGATAGSTALLDTANRGMYLAGLEAVPGVAFRLATAPVGEQVARAGYYDENNGIGFGVDVDGMFVFIRKAGVETKVRRADWIDPLDGTGPSGQSIDPLDLNIYRLPFRWYGAGPARFQVSTISDQLWPTFTLAHILTPASGTIFNAPNVPIRAEVENGATASALEMMVGGRQFGVLGRYAPTFRVISEHRAGVGVPTTGFTPLLAIRAKEAFRDRRVMASGIDVLTDQNLVVELRIGGALTGAAFATPSETAAAETAMEADKTATAYANGDKTFSMLAAGGTGNRSRASGVDLPDIVLAPSDTLVLCAQALSSSATVSAVLRWKEEW